MARFLNKSRVYTSKLIILLAVAVVLFTRQSFMEDESPVHELLDLAGILLVALCAMGRLYCTAFLGGNKNVNLVTHGPFSVVRNPLYVFSLVGVAGIALMSNHLLLMVLLPAIFVIMYHRLIAREEVHLREVFGEQYDAYCRNVPRMIPDFKKYNAPDSVQTSPKLLLIAFRDATLWFVPYQLFELIEFLQEMHWLPSWSFGA